MSTDFASKTREKLKKFRDVIDEGKQGGRRVRFTFALQGHNVFYALINLSGLDGRTLHMDRKQRHKLNGMIFGHGRGDDRRSRQVSVTLWRNFSPGELIYGLDGIFEDIELL